MNQRREGRAGALHRGLAGPGWFTGERRSGGRDGWRREGEGHCTLKDFFLRHTLKGLLWMDLDFFIVGLDWIGCYKFCFEFGLDEDLFSLTFCWIQTFGFWMPVHSQE